ncbi:MAG: thioredoxin [Gemmatimonadaceae bacterium]|nr:thioredoxin [Gemmatimonadaceae bacterium]
MTSAPTPARLAVPCPFCGAINHVAATRVGDRPRCGNAACAKPLLLDRPVALHDRDFTRAVQDTTVPVLVDFYADWCGPCKMMAPILDDVAASFAGRLLVAKVNTDVEQTTAMAYQIRSIPTLVLLQSGQPVAQQAGAVPKAAILQLLSRVGL